MVKLDKWISGESANTKSPTLANIISEILARQGQSGITRLKSASQMLIFLQHNNICDMLGLEDKVKSMRGKVGRLREDLKPVNRRIKTLDEHIKHSENFKNYRAFKNQYDELYSLYKSARKATGFGAERKTQKALDALTNITKRIAPSCSGTMLPKSICATFCRSVLVQENSR